MPTTRPETPLRASGVTLVETVIAMGIMAIIALLATQTYISFIRDDHTRRKTADVQQGARAALELLERDLRHASLGSGTGRIWILSDGNRVARPAVQLYTDVAGTGTIDLTGTWPDAGAPKADTDALLVVEAVGGARAATVGALAGAPTTVPVTTVSATVDGVSHSFVKDDAVLVGDYNDASWAVLAENGDSATNQLTATSALALPGQLSGQLAAGAIVRRARARLYYVDARDQLVRLELSVPRAPATSEEVLTAEVLAQGVENLQLACEIGQPNGTLTAGGGGAAGELADEAAPFFGSAGAAIADASTVRTVIVDVVARSRTPLVASHGDDPVTLDGVTLSPGSAPDGEYVRRAYQLTSGVRNTSLGDL